MPPLTPGNIAGSILIGLVAASCFKGWRAIGMGVFCFAWQAFTPRRPFLYDLFLMMTCLAITELFFRRFTKSNKQT